MLTINGKCRDNNPRIVTVAHTMSSEGLQETIDLSLTEAETAVHEFSRNNGFAVSRARSIKDKSGEIRKVYVKCVHRGTFIPVGHLRYTSSLKTNCRWEAILKRTYDITRA